MEGVGRVNTGRGLGQRAGEGDGQQFADAARLEGADDGERDGTVRIVAHGGVENEFHRINRRRRFQRGASWRKCQRQQPRET
ncbi:hypothetical protein OH491_10280 [Termitidicoccus mucosus]|uniref:Uncharacterized protein n=1 Tax=Termitidicoccus mucosus TaxID=1184151 RepID=A0A178IEV0_9BACT|nr:hypothetical protein AW736_17060 [Opitutaceae bacterium TSB47]